MCNDVTKQTFYQNNGRRRNSSNPVAIIDDTRHLFCYCFDILYENKVIKEKNLSILFLHV